MRKVAPEVVQKQFEDWRGYYQDNNDRGVDCIQFAAGNQWSSSVSALRAANNKESLVFNLCAKEEKRMKAQLREIEFSLNLAPTNKEWQDKVEESNAFRMILSSLILNDNVRNKFYKSANKCVEFGYSGALVSYGYEDDKSLFTEPKLIIYEDPSCLFWDKDAVSPTKIDGKYCGVCKKVSGEEIKRKLGKYIKSQRIDVKDKDNKLIYYWYRDYKPMTFVLLKNGKYAREDLLTYEEKQMLEDEKGAEIEYELLNDEDKLAQGNKPLPLVKCEDVCLIFFQIICNDYLIGKPKLFPTDDLPLVYHHGYTVWYPEEGKHNNFVTLPLIYNIKDPQKLLNFINSQIATIAKNSSSDKWFFSEDHVLSPTQIEDAKNINTKEGGFIFGGDSNTIRRERPAELPATMVQMGQVTKQQIDEISGSMLDQSTAQQNVISGVAVDKITHNLAILNVDFIANHIEFVNCIGHLYRQMIPRLYTQERVLIAKNADGSGEAIVINQDTGTNDIINNIRDINSNFHYEITAGPSTTAQKETTLSALTTFYQVNPEAAKKTGDIYMRNLPSPDSGELERRLSADIPDSLINYSQGKITREGYLKQVQEMQKVQAQTQLQIQANSPEVKAIMSQAAAESEKAKAMQFDAVTKRATAMEKVKTDRMKIAEETKKSFAQVLIDVERLKAQVIDQKIRNDLDIIEKQISVSQHNLDVLSALQPEEIEGPAQQQQQPQEQAQQPQEQMQEMPNAES